MNSYKITEPHLTGAMFFTAKTALDAFSDYLFLFDVARPDLVKVEVVG
jgi:hypothetical protein